MLEAWKTYKGWSRQGSWCSPLEGVAEAIRGIVLLREWLGRPFPPTGPLQSMCMCTGILKPQQQIFRGRDLHQTLSAYCVPKTILLPQVNNPMI